MKEKAQKWLNLKLNNMINAKSNSEPSQTFKVELFEKIVNDFRGKHLC